MTEQRYKAVLAVIANGRTVGEVASEWSVCRQTMHRWLERYEGEGLEGLGDRSHRSAHCAHQMPAATEAKVLEMLRTHAYWERGESPSSWLTNILKRLQSLRSIAAWFAPRSSTP